MKKVQIKLFIVPNPAVVFDGCSGNGNVNAPNRFSNLKEFVDNVNMAREFGFDVYDFGSKIGGELTTSDAWVQVWCHDADNDNLTNHGIPEDHPVYGPRREEAPSFLPARFIREIAKGGFKTSIRADGEDVEIEWVSSQETTRYSRFGSMNDVLELVLTKCERYAKPAAKEMYEKYLALCGR